MSYEQKPPGASRPVDAEERPADSTYTYSTSTKPSAGAPHRRAAGPTPGGGARSWLMILAVIVLALIVLEFFTGWGQGYVLGTGTMDVDATPGVSADVSPADPGDPAPAAPAD